MTRLLPLAALLLATACNRQETAPPPANIAETPAAPAVKAAVPSLEGQWRLTTPAALDLTIGDSSATLSSGCLTRGFTFRQDRNQVTFTSAPARSNNCGRSPTLAEETAFAALSDANLAVFDQDGRKVTLSGLGGMLAIERR